MVVISHNTKGIGIFLPRSINVGLYFNESSPNRCNLRRNSKCNYTYGLPKSINHNYPRSSSLNRRGPGVPYARWNDIPRKCVHQFTPEYLHDTIPMKFSTWMGPYRPVSSFRGDRYKSVQIWAWEGRPILAELLRRWHGVEKIFSFAISRFGGDLYFWSFISQGSIFSVCLHK